jgi:hypothetical protein
MRKLVLGIEKKGELVLGIKKRHKTSFGDRKRSPSSYTIPKIDFHVRKVPLSASVPLFS